LVEVIAMLSNHPAALALVLSDLTDVERQQRQMQAAHTGCPSG
jgi:hypothetical protein